MERITKWIKRNKGLFIVLLLTLILLIFIIVIFVKLLVGNSKDKYGNRLDGIENIMISKETYDGVESEVMDTTLVEEVSVRRQGKIVYTTIILKADTGRDKAKEIAANTLDNYSEEELAFYDFSFFLKWEGEEADTVITGNKHSNLESISWVNS